ncbi:MAG: FHA domain-containing protein [Caldilineaceae bacterium]|nr:FHA domain-containing protein [Caldilineaceae bacterium]
MQCPSCGNPVTLGEAFCDNCGAALPPVSPPANPAAGSSTGALIAPADQNSTMPPLSPLTAKLVINSDGTAFELTPGKTLLIGRLDPIDGIYPDIDLTPHDRDAGVSRRHAELYEQGGQWFIKDLGSTNYTVINRKRAQPDQEMLLQNGDEVRLARVMIHFQTGT